MSWIALTEAEVRAVAEAMPGGIDGFLKGWGWSQFAQAIEDKCRVKNERPESDEAEYDVRTDDMHCASACGPRAVALAEARNYALQYLGESDVVHIEEVTRTVVERYSRISPPARDCCQSHPKDISTTKGKP